MEKVLLRCSSSRIRPNNHADVLKRPMQTSVTIDNLDFQKFEVQEQLQIGIVLKDFKSIVTHAESMKTSITAQYSFPNRPMQFRYSEGGVQCEFTLMTIGDSRGSSLTPASEESRQNSITPLQERQQQRTTQRLKITMPPPTQPASLSKGSRSNVTNQRPSPPPPKPSLDPESLFLPQHEDEDRQWGERHEKDDEDTVGWSASAIRVSTPSKL